MSPLHTSICDLFGIRYPSVVAGMGGMHAMVVPPSGQGGRRLHKVEPAKTVFGRPVREPLEALDRPSTIPTQSHATAT